MSGRATITLPAQFSKQLQGVITKDIQGRYSKTREAVLDEAEKRVDGIVKYIVKPKTNKILRAMLHTYYIGAMEDIAKLLNRGISNPAAASLNTRLGGIALDWNSYELSKRYARDKKRFRPRAGNSIWFMSGGTYKAFSAEIDRAKEAVDKAELVFQGHKREGDSAEGRRVRLYFKATLGRSSAFGRVDSVTRRSFLNAAERHSGETIPNPIAPGTPGGKWKSKGFFPLSVNEFPGAGQDPRHRPFMAKVAAQAGAKFREDLLSAINKIRLR